MKNHSILTAWLAACLLTAAPPDVAAAAAAAPAVSAASAAQVDAASEACAAGSYAGGVAQVQRDLNRIYAADAAFKKEAGNQANPLRDGKLGPVTRHWLGMFCAQHPFKVRAASFDADVAAELARFGVAKERPAAPAMTLPAMDATWRYDPANLRKPQDVELIVARLVTLTDRYAELDAFEAAVRRAAKGLTLDAETLGRIVRFSALDGYLLSADEVAQLKGATPELSAKLLSKAGVDYTSADEFHLELDSVMTEGAEKAELARFATRIDQLARVTHYRIPGTIAADLSGAAALEPPVAALYASVAKIAYPSEALFALALRARLERALDMCPNNRHRHDGKLTDGDVKTLWSLMDGNEQVGDVLQLRAVAERCKPQQLARAAALLDGAHKVFYAKLYKAVWLFNPNMAPAAAGQGGPVASKGCGCAPDPREGLTYGFYPLWTDATKGTLDFDVLSRIGLYGLTVDDHGALNRTAGVNTLPWTLLEAAHRHLTKVDWVLYKNDWDAAKGAGMADLLANLRQSIDGLLRTPFPGTDWRGTALATFGLEQGPSAGDGIVLRFEGFPGTKPEREALGNFIQALGVQLHAMKPARQLYLMVTQADIVGAGGADDLADTEERPFSADHLHTLMQKANPVSREADWGDIKRTRADDLQVLVLMQEPTASEKLRLRANVEDALYSTDRIRVLRNIIPVVEYDGVRAGQLGDDIGYFRDNFGGIGFWPLSFTSPEDDIEGATTGNAVLHFYFNRDGIDGGVVANVMDLICPNRAWLRWLAWVSAILAVVAGVTLARCRGCGTRLDSNMFYMAGMIALIVLPFLVISALVVGDPLFKSDSGVHWVIAAILIAVVIIPGAYGLLKPARKLP